MQYLKMMIGQPIFDKLQPRRRCKRINGGGCYIPLDSFYDNQVAIFSVEKFFYEFFLTIFQFINGVTKTNFLLVNGFYMWFKPLNFLKGKSIF